MKKTIITTLLVFISLFANAQDRTRYQFGDRFFEKGNSYWTADATFGIIAIWTDDADSQKLKEGTNVGATLGVSRTFESNFFTSASVSFSVAESTGLWENPLDYLAVNLEGGYKFKTDTFFVPFVALGGSYIQAPNTIANSKSSVALNPSLGFNMWFMNTSLGFTTKYGFRVVSNDYMETHQYLTIGLTKKF